MNTSIDEIAPNTYRIATGIPTPDGAGFSFNQYLLAAEEPLLWHTGGRRLFEATRGAIARVLEKVVQNADHLVVGHRCGAGIARIGHVFVECHVEFL